MIKDLEMCQRLNLVRSSPSFVLQEFGAEGAANVIAVDVVPQAQGVFWVAGTTVAKSGRRIDSVFRVDTDSGGSLRSVFWWIDGEWYDREHNDALTALGLSHAEVFPFSWGFSVPLEDDAFHVV